MINRSELENYLNVADQETIDRCLLVDHDGGKLSIHIIELFERFYKIKLPRLYKLFISQHNGAYLRNSEFPQGGIRFSEFGDIIPFLDSIILGNTTKEYDTYPEWHIPFGDDGGEGEIFFDYSDDHNSDNPQIVMIAEGTETFIANSFEEFIDMLYEYKDE
ncbi:MAG: SMI1/KNR4 family protein [Alphaproteobacteria bacterium]|nr:SMI1/KNR4 family protein [Alphaproteobacteria bacterium]